MKNHAYAAMAAALIFGGCTCSKTADNPLSPGTDPYPSGNFAYDVSDLQIQDGCQIGAEFPKPFVMSVSGTTAVLDAFAGTPRGEPQGESVKLAAPHTVSHKVDGVPFDCVERVDFKLELTRTSEKVYAATLTYASKTDSGKECNRTPYLLPCTTKATFTATRLPPGTAIEDLKR